MCTCRSVISGPLGPGVNDGGIAMVIDIHVPSEPGLGSEWYMRLRSATLPGTVPINDNWQESPDAADG